MGLVSDVVVPTAAGHVAVHVRPKLTMAVDIVARAGRHASLTLRTCKPP